MPGLATWRPPPKLRTPLRLVRLPYHLSAITQATALAALTHREALMADVEDIKVQRDRIVTELTRMGLKPAASDSNYVFFGGLENPHAGLAGAAGRRGADPRCRDPRPPAGHGRN